MLQIKFDCNRPAGLGDIHVWKCERMDARTHARTPARVPSYKLTLWAFGSGELKSNRLHVQVKYEKSIVICLQSPENNPKYAGIFYKPQIITVTDLNQKTNGPVMLTRDLSLS